MITCMTTVKHKPVMVREVAQHLQLAAGMTIIDATLGAGGHAQEILKHIGPGGRLIGIDRDNESLEMAKENLKSHESQCVFIQDNFCNIDRILTELNIPHIDGVMVDLGISSFQLDNPQRGFSFMQEGPLDMRMDRTSSISAFDLLYNLTEDEIASILWRYGQERFSRRIARVIVEQRKTAAINTTVRLTNAVLRAIPRSKREWRIHPATRTFQALRIAVNRELESFDIFLHKIEQCMKPGARLCTIAFHSLEDRIAKHYIREAAHRGAMKRIVKKPCIASPDEVKENPRARSAKLRIAEKI